MTREELADVIDEASFAGEPITDAVLAALEGHAIVGGQPVRMSSDDPLVFVHIDGKAITERLEQP